jgi:hypothetical protein
VIYPTRFEVEWVSDLPQLGGENDWDSATFSFRDFNRKKDAMVFAKKIAPNAANQVATVREWCEGDFDLREYIGPSIEVAAEEGK